VPTRLLELARELAATRPGSLSDALELTLMRVCDATGWEWGQGSLADDRGTLTRVATWPPDAAARGTELPIAATVPVLAGGETVAVLEFFARLRRDEDGQQAELVAVAVAGLGPLIRAERLEAALGRSEAAYQAVVETATDAIVSADATGTITDCNPAATRIFGHAREAMIGSPLTMLMPERLRAAHRHGLARHVATGEARIAGATVDLSGLRADGTEFPLELSLASRQTADGWAFTGFVRDVSQRERIALRISESEIQLAETQSLAQVGSFEWNRATGELAWSDELYRIYGLDPADGPVDPARVRELIHPRDREAVVDRNVMGLQDGQRLSFAHRIVRPDGAARIVHVLGEAFVDGDGRPVRLVGTIQDVTERRRDERGRRLAEERFRQAFENAPIGMGLVAIDGSWIQVNRALCEIVGRSRAELTAMRFQDITHPDELDGVLEEYTRLLLDEIRFHQTETRYVHADGSELPIRLSVSLVRDSDGDPLYSVAQVEDIGDRVRSERAANEGRARLQAFIDNASAAVYLKDLDGRYLVVNSAAAEMVGLAPAELMGKTDHEVLPKEAADPFVETDRAALAEDGPISREVAIRIGGEERTHLIQKFVLHDAGGAPEAIGGITTDITDRVRIEAVNRRLEAELQQAQRLEMLGRLAGGVAHDFNNLLAVVMSYATLVADRLPADSPARADIDEIMRAAERAGALTHQLVVFSRGERVEAEIIDLKVVVNDLERLLSRTIGEDIELVIDHEPGLWRAEVSTSQLERILLNLAVNAREAMPTGGTLTIATRNVELDADSPESGGTLSPGKYVSVCVSDTGVGMEPAVASRAFDPFFTTRPAGEGSGLGLATVYGAVTRAGGRIEVSTSPGKGAKFEFYLAAVDTPEPRPPTTAVAEIEPGDGVLLVVEDEDAVREPLVRVLGDHGYQVLGTRGPAEALAVSDSRPEPIDLLLTDVVMPEMSGRELADQIRRARPEIAVLFMSGYTDDVVVKHGVRDGSGTSFVQKPFTTNTLLAEVSRALRASRASTR
jgi:PAS domain S-box-containing protein